MNSVFQPVKLDARFPGLRMASKFTLYRRPSAWYVNYSTLGRQYRISTGTTSREEAEAMVLALRPTQGERTISKEHVIRMIERARYRSRRKGLPFSLTIGDMEALVKRSGGLCEVSGHPLTDDGPFRPSLDRIDPGKGYVADNLRIVCVVTNTAMLHFGETALLAIATSLCRKAGLIKARS